MAKDSAIHNGTEALIDIFKKLKPGEPITQDGVVNFLVQKFFDDKRYDLGRAGRFKYSVKLGAYDRLIGRVLAENLSLPMVRSSPTKPAKLSSRITS